MERYLKFREEYSRFFYRGYDVEETLNELKITYTFEIEGLSAFTPTWTFPKNGNPEANLAYEPGGWFQLGGYRRYQLFC